VTNPFNNPFDNPFDNIKKGGVILESLKGKPGQRGSDGTNAKPKDVAKELKSDKSFLLKVKGKKGDSVKGDKGDSIKGDKGDSVSPGEVARLLKADSRFIALTKGSPGEAIKGKDAPVEEIISLVKRGLPKTGNAYTPSIGVSNNGERVAVNPPNINFIGFTFSRTGQIVNISNTISIVTKEDNYTTTTDDDTVLVNAATGNIEITLHTAVGAIKPVVITRIDGSVNTVTLETSGTETIQRCETQTIGIDETFSLVPSNGNWWLNG